MARRSGIRALLLGTLALAGLGGCTAKAPIETVTGDQASGAARLVIDVRDPEPFAGGHLPGALNIQLSWGQLAGRTRSYVPDLAQPLAVRAEGQADAERAAAVLLELGYSDFVRVIPLAEEGPGNLELISAAKLAQLLADDRGATLQVLDIRTSAEFAKGTIQGALCIDQDGGPELASGLDRQSRYAVICAGGWRSSQLASWMQRQGFPHVLHVIDGMSAWADLE